MFGVVGHLLLPTALRLVDAGPHRRGNAVGIHQDLALRVSRGAAHRLDEAGLAAKEALLVRIQDCHKADFRNIQALAQEVDAHQHVKGPGAEIADDLHALDGSGVGVHVAGFDSGGGEVLGQVLGHFLCQSRDQAALSPVDLGVDLADEVVDLPLDGPDEDLRIQKARRADDLFGQLPGAFALVGSRRRRDVYPLVNPLFKLFKHQRPVVVGRGQAEAVLHQRVLPRPVTPVHSPHLGQSHMALIHKEKEILREIVQQRHRGRARRAVRDHAGIVFDAAAVAQLLHHLDVIVRTLADPLGFDELVIRLEIPDPLVTLDADSLDGGFHLFLRRHIVARRIDGNMVQHAGRIAGDDVDLTDPVDLVAEELHPDRLVVGIGREDFEAVAPDAELVALKGQVVAFIADLHQLPQQVVEIPGLSRPQRNHHVGVVDGVSQAVDAAHRRHHNHVPALEEARRGAVAQALNLVVDGGVLLDEGIRMRDVGLRLVVVVVAHKILHSVFREELPEFAAELSGKNLVVRQDQCRPVHALDDIGHGEGFARAGDTEQDLLVDAVFNAGDQRVDCRRLVTHGLIRGLKLKVIHKSLITAY